MFGEVSYPKLANVQNKNSFYKKKNEEEKNIYINIYIYPFCILREAELSSVGFLCIHKVIFVL